MITEHAFKISQRQASDCRFHLNLTCFLLGGGEEGGSDFMKGTSVDHSPVSSLIAILTLAEKSWLTAAKKRVPSPPEEMSNEGYDSFPRLQVKLWQAEVSSFHLCASRHFFPG